MFDLLHRKLLTNGITIVNLKLLLDRKIDHSVYSLNCVVNFCHNEILNLRHYLAHFAFLRTLLDLILEDLFNDFISKLPLILKTNFNRIKSLIRIINYTSLSVSMLRPH